MSNSIAKKPSFSVAINTTQLKTAINNTLQDPDRVRRFTSSIVSAVSTNPALQECDSATIVTAALLGESLNLSPSPQLGQYYLVPYTMKEKKDKNGNIIRPETTVAQFQLGYKGYMQLAMRSGQVKKLNVIEIKQGELKSFDPLNEEIECVIIDDWDARNQAPTIGYYAMFELVNGFRKVMYWTKDKMLCHADAYSPAFSKDAYAKLLNNEIPEKEKWKYSSFWYKNFDDMAKKTMIRQLISKGGCPMSIEMQKAYEADMGVVNDDNTVTYVDSPDVDDTIPVETVPTEAPKEVSLNEV